jgi:P-type conjugative transfer protein TrbL
MHLKQYWNKLSKAKKIFLLFFLLPAIALAITVSHQEIVNAIRNSPTANSWLKQNAEAIANLAINVESGGRLDIYNGSCCYGVLQMNKNNIRVYAKMTPEQFRNADLQTQINAWAKLTSDAMKNPVVQRLAAMKTFDGRPVTGELVLACIQLGVGNCNKMLQSGSCNGFRDRLGTSICDMADKMSKGKGKGTATSLDPGEPPPEPPTIFSAEFLDQIMNTYEDAAVKWMDTLLSVATYLFWTLVLISLTWTGTTLIFQRANIAEFFSELLKFILFFGFFYWLLIPGNYLVKDIMESFIGLGLRAADSNSGSLSTGSYIGLLFNLWTDAFSGISSLSIPEKLAATIMLAITFIALAFIAVVFVLLNISAWVYLYAGIFTLGFGGSRWTSYIAINYYKQILNLGLQLMTAILLMSISQQLMQYTISAGEQLVLKNYVYLLLIGILLAILVNKVPPMVGSTVTFIGNNQVLSLSNAANTTHQAGKMLLNSVLLMKKPLISAFNAAKSVKNKTK